VAERGSGLARSPAERQADESGSVEGGWVASVGVGGSEELSHMVCSRLEPEIAISGSGFVRPTCLVMFVRVPTL
jgi:hypothetical protein